MPESLSEFLTFLTNERRVSRRQVLLASAGVALAACGLPGSKSTPSGGSGPYTLGVIQPLSGANAGAFKPLYAPLQLAIDEINKGGGILGRKLETDVADDAASAAQEPAVAQQLLSNGRTIIFGPVQAAQSLASLAITQKSNVLQIPVGADDSLNDVTKYPGTFLFAIRTTVLFARAVTLIQAINASKIAILYENTAFGQSAFRITTDAVSKLNGVRIVENVSYDVGSPADAAIAKLKASSPDVALLLASAPGTIAQVLSAMIQSDFMPISFNGSAYLNEIQTVMKNVAIPPAFRSKLYLPAFKSLCWSPGKPVGQAQRSYISKVQPQLPAGPLYPTIQTPLYDAMYTLKHVIEGVNSFDYGKVKQGLENLKAFRGVLADYTITKSNHGAVEDSAVVLATPTDPSAPESLGFLPKLATP